MRIAVVSRANALGGGASRIAEDLSRGLLGAGRTVTHFCGVFAGPPQPFQAPLFQGRFRSALLRLVRRRTRASGLSMLPLEDALLYRRLLADYDVVHFHDHAATVSMGSIARLSQRKPVFFTAHDFLHLTGGCIYPLSCEAYKTRCGACPQRASIGRFDFTRHNQAQNRRAAQQAIRYIYPSDWLRREAEQHLRWRLPGVTIPNGFEPGPYQFKSRDDARRQLGLAAHRPVICISAHYLADPRKGVNFALAAARSVADLRPLVILIGNPLDHIEQHLPGVEYWCTGLVESRARMGLLFAAADVFLFTSLQDNLPITIQEAMAAGTPIVGFAAGGVPEMVDHGRTGWLVPTGDQAALDRALRAALTTEDRHRIGNAAVERVRTAYDPGAFVQAHIGLYEQAAPVLSTPAPATTSAP